MTWDTHKLSPKFMGSRKPVRLSSFPLRICQTEKGGSLVARTSQIRAPSWGDHIIWSHSLHQVLVCWYGDILYMSGQQVSPSCGKVSEWKASRSALWLLWLPAPDHHAVHTAALWSSTALKTACSLYCWSPLADLVHKAYTDLSTPSSQHTKSIPLTNWNKSLLHRCG